MESRLSLPGAVAKVPVSKAEVLLPVVVSHIVLAPFGCGSEWSRRPAG